MSAKRQRVDAGDPAPLVSRAELVAVPTAAREFPWATKIRRSLALAEMDEGEAACLMGVDASEWSKQLAGKPGHHVSFPRLLKLPARFWGYLLPDLAGYFGFRVESQSALASAAAEMLEACSNVMRLVDLPQPDGQPQRQRQRA